MFGMGLGLTVADFKQIAIAIAIAPTLLNNPAMAIPAAIYSLLMFVTGGAFALWSRKRQTTRVISDAA